MMDRFTEFLQSIVVMDETEMEILLSHAKTEKLRKRQYLQRPGEVCESVAWVAKGCLRMFLTDHHGKEHIIEIAVENQLIADRQSLSDGTPSAYAIDALEETEIITFSKEAITQLHEQDTSFGRLSHLLTQNELANYQSRVAVTLKLSADEKYKLIMRQNPTLMERVPQHMIASYMGITPAALSRVRKKFLADGDSPQPTKTS